MGLIELEDTDLIQRLKRCVTACAAAHRQLLAFVNANAFATREEEMSFFRTMKPYTGSLLQYYNSLLRLELSKPAGSFDMLYRYYGQEQEGIRRFYEENKFLVSYYRSGETFLDDKLFVRVEGTVGAGIGNPPQDGSLSSLCDSFVTAFLSNERLACWLNDAMAPRPDKPASSQAGSMKWTDSKASLVELLYALHRRGSLNSGQASLKDIAGFLEGMLGVDLGNYYRTFQELRIRKTGRTSYLDNLKRGLIQYMDETDLNYKG